MKIALIILAAGMAFGQTTKSKPVESIEHKVATKALEVWDEGRAERLSFSVTVETTLVKLSNKATEIKDQHDYTVNWIKRHPDEDHGTLMDDVEWLANEYKATLDKMTTLKQNLVALQTKEEEVSKLLKQRLDYVDGCLKVYRVTIDMKPSDLTIRQTEQVKECRSLDLYPPSKS